MTAEISIKFAISDALDWELHKESLSDCLTDEAERGFRHLGLITDQDFEGEGKDYHIKITFDSEDFICTLEFL